MRGIIVGCDSGQEWLLPWWWNHYSKSGNSYPVAFIDFGMSEIGLEWCRKRGRCISLSSTFPLKSISSQKRKLWESASGCIWPFRSAWFKKPQAFLHTPFPLSCWIDLDCEVRGDLAPLFNSLGLGVDISLVREPEGRQDKDRKHDLIFSDEVTYNSGVVAFREAAEIILRWAELALRQNHEFLSDQNALSRLIYTDRPPMMEFPQIYNWPLSLGPNPEAVVFHYVCACKVAILESLPRNKEGGLSANYFSTE